MMLVFGQKRNYKKSNCEEGDRISKPVLQGSLSCQLRRGNSGGYIVGSSRNDNATPNTEGFSTGGSSWDYIKDKSTGSSVSGWRLFDISNRAITLISAGNPEDYSPGNFSSTTSSFEQAYILTGVVDDRWKVGNLYIDSINRRYWNDYINENQMATEAKPLTLSRIEKWYKKFYGNEPGR